MIKLALSPIALFFACTLCGSCQDGVVELSGTYFYRDEGGRIKDILSTRGDHEIPATVIAYVFNEDFILAKQRPKLPADPLYSMQPEYMYGAEYVYFWIIDHDHDKIWGPLHEEEYLRTRYQLGVPSELVLPP